MRTERRDAQGGDPTAALSILKQTTAGTDAPEVEGIIDDLNKALNEETEETTRVVDEDMKRVEFCPVCDRPGRECNWFIEWDAKGRPRDEYEHELRSKFGARDAFDPRNPQAPNYGYYDPTRKPRIR